MLGHPQHGVLCGEQDGGERENGQRGRVAEVETTVKAESSSHGTVMERSQSCIITRRRRGNTSAVSRYGSHFRVTVTFSSSYS